MTVTRSRNTTRTARGQRTGDQTQMGFARDVPAAELFDQLKAANAEKLTLQEQVDYWHTQALEARVDRLRAERNEMRVRRAWRNARARARKWQRQAELADQLRQDVTQEARRAIDAGHRSIEELQKKLRQQDPSY